MFGLICLTYLPLCRSGIGLVHSCFLTSQSEVRLELRLDEPDVDSTLVSLSFSIWEMADSSNLMRKITQDAYIMITGVCLPPLQHAFWSDLIKYDSVTSLTMLLCVWYCHGQRCTDQTRPHDLDTPFIHHLCVWLPRVGVYKVVFQALNNRGILGQFSSPEIHYVTVSRSIYISA